MVQYMKLSFMREINIIEQYLPCQEKNFTGKSNHNICGIRLDCGSEVFQEYALKYGRAFKGWNLLEIDII